MPKCVHLAGGGLCRPARSLLVTVSLLTFSFSLLTSVSWAQVSHSEQVQIKPPLLRIVDPPAPDATVADLEARADELHAKKLYLDAIDYYRAALAKKPNYARILNKVCRTQLMMQRWSDAKKSFEQSIKADRNFADPYSNLGVALYEEKNTARRSSNTTGDCSRRHFGGIFQQLGAALFSKREFEPAVRLTNVPFHSIPKCLSGVRGAGCRPNSQPRRSSPLRLHRGEAYAKMGYSDRSLEYLRKAMEEGYKDFKNVYKDVEFAELRKDKRFTELMATKPPTLPE